METTTRDFILSKGLGCRFLSLDIDIGKIIIDYWLTHQIKFTTAKENYFLIWDGSSLALSKSFQPFDWLLLDPFVLMSVVIAKWKTFPTTDEVNLIIYDHIHRIKVDEWFPA